MAIRTIEVPCYQGLDTVPLLDAALALARPLGAHIEAAYVRMDTMAGLAVVPPASLVVDALTLPGREAGQRADLARQQGLFEGWCAAHGLGHLPVHHRLDSVFARWTVVDGPLGAVVTRRGRLADVTVVCRPDASDPGDGQGFDAAVFETGRLAMVLSERVPQPLLRHVLVAWNGSREAARTVAQSLGLLHAAETVSVFTGTTGDDVETPGPELVAALRWQGIEARLMTHHGTPASVGQALLRTLAVHEVTLLVMGAYTHWKLRQRLLGGVTHDILRDCPIPVIMAH